MSAESQHSARMTVASRLTVKVPGCSGRITGYSDITDRLRNVRTADRPDISEAGLPSFSYDWLGVRPMESDLNTAINLTLSKAACLVLFELLTDSYEVWRRANPADSSAGAMLVSAGDGSHRAALWELEGSLERTLPELFSSNYADLVAASKRLLNERIGPSM